MTLPAVDSYAAGNNLGSLNRSPRTIMAQAMRAILFASATAATLIGRRSIRRASQSRFVPCWHAYPMTAMAPATSSQRKCRLPCFEILPSRSLPPVECCLGTKPIHAARLRPDENVFQPPTSATRAVATIGRRLVEIMARHRVPLPRDAKHHVRLAGLVRIAFTTSRAWARPLPTSSASSTRPDRTRRSTPCERRFPKGCSKCSRYPACPEPQPKSGPSGPRAQSLSQAAPLQYGRTVRHWRRLTLLRHCHRAISRRGYDQLSTLKPVVGVAFALRRSKWARVRRDVHFLPPVVGR